MKVSRIEPLGKDLLLGWTEDATKAYIESKPLAAGDTMVVVNTFGGFTTYVLTAVINPALGRQRRVLLSGLGQAYAGSTFYRSGKNCYAPKGQTRMIPPTPLLAPFLSEPGDMVELNGRYGAI